MEEQQRTRTYVFTYKGMQMGRLVYEDRLSAVIKISAHLGEDTAGFSVL